MTKKHFIIIIVSLFAIVSFLIGSRFFLKDSSKDIKTILASESYSYLPLVVQQYIEDRYLETGELLLTEVNHGENDYYLNPEFVNYLASEHQEDYEVIPEETIVDYVYSGYESSTELPSKFDLRSVNGKNFITPYKNQGQFGLCWSFATMEQAESYLLVKNDRTYTSGAVNIFSARHADYVTARDAIVDTRSPYRINRDLKSGGTFKNIVDFAADGLSFVDDSWIDYNSSKTKLEYNYVFNYANSLYELNSTINMPSADLGYVSEENKAEYLKRLKQAIMQYGGAYVATSSPTGNCSIVGNDGNRFIYSDGYCSSTGHAMQIIGWDDSYTYLLCTNMKNANNEYYISGSINNCPTEDLVWGQGAWILRNSWGNSNQIVHLAYDSQRSTINLSTDIGIKNWDNHYRNKGVELNLSQYDSSNDSTIVFKRTFDHEEILNKIKLELLSQGSIYSVFFSPNGSTSNLSLIGTITCDLPGLYTLNLLNENLKITSNNFIIRVQSSTGKFTIKSLNVYTNNAYDVQKIKTYDSSFSNDLSLTDKYRFRIESDVTGIADNERVTYKILYQNREEIIPYYTYKENIVAGGKVFSELFIDETLNKGNYILQTLYNDEVLSESNLFVRQQLVSIEGTGTKYDPYLIKEPAQLDLIRNDPTAYYKLNNDIDMTYDTQNPNGLFYNNGQGWLPLFSDSISIQQTGILLKDYDGFSGNLDGDGHKIIGLYINRPLQDYVGLFSSIYNDKSNEAGISNLILVNPRITGRNYVGGIVGLASGFTYTSCLALENLAVSNGKIEGSRYVGGIAGYLQGGGILTGACTDTGTKRFRVHSLFNSAIIQADDYAAGIIGYLTNYRYQPASSIAIHDIQNVGVVYSEGNSSGLISIVKDNNGVDIEIKNALSTGRLSGSVVHGIIDDYLFASNQGKIYLKKIYYSSSTPFPDSSRIYMDLNNSVYKKNAYELTSITQWTGFDDYWIQETINNKKRIPLLKIMQNSFDYYNFIGEYISVNMDSHSPVSIYDYMRPNNALTQNNIYSVSNDNISVSSGGNIIANKKGQSILTITSLYDGSVHSVNVYVNKSPEVYYHSNFSNDVYVQSIENGTGILESNRFIRPGYSFVNWNSQPDGSGDPYQNETNINIADDIHLYAQWQVDEYTVSFITNNGDVINPISVEYGKKIDLSNISLEKEGYIFAGWYYDSKFFNKYSSNDTITNNITLYAKWDSSSFSIEDITSYELIGPYISIPVKTTKDDLDFSDEYTIVVEYNSGNSNGNKKYVGSGDTIIIYDKNSNTELSRYNVMVLADANGDGKINSGDLYAIVSHLIPVDKLTGAKEKAADANGDGRVNSGDLTWICQYLIDNPV